MKAFPYILPYRVRRSVVEVPGGFHTAEMAKADALTQPLPSTTTTNFLLLLLIHHAVMSLESTILSPQYRVILACADQNDAVGQR